MAATAWKATDPGVVLYIVKSNAILEYRWSSVGVDGIVDTDPAVSVVIPDNGSTQVFPEDAPIAVVDTYDLGTNTLTLFVYGHYAGITAIHYFHCTSAGNEWTYDSYYAAQATWLSAAAYYFTGEPVYRR